MAAHHIVNVITNPGREASRGGRAVTRGERRDTTRAPRDRGGTVFADVDVFRLGHDLQSLEEVADVVARL